jgi:putative oxygen-independent coproporphyrinogen III oxidase
MTPEEADGYQDTAAAYVHIPFCSAICPYCDFAVVAGRNDLANRYVDAVVTEIGRSEAWQPLQAVYFGGGTPSQVDPALLDRIVDALEAKHGIADEVELSLEANPEDFTANVAVRLKEIGFNRISFGAQSFDDRVLVALGRRHVGSRVARSVHAAREVGFENVSIDLIYGTPVESDTSWAGTLEEAIALEPDHISAYALTVEPGTELGRSVRGGAPAPDPDSQADRYWAADRIFGVAGLSRYEVSNWSKPGSECRYNLTVWAQGEYEAYGNGAHGHRRGRRFRNYRRLDSYLEAVESGRAAVIGSEPLFGWEKEIDRMFVGLRRRVGVAAGPGVDAFTRSLSAAHLLDLGIARLIEDRLVVTDPLLTDEVHRVVLGLSAPQGWAQPTHADIVAARQDA